MIDALLDAIRDAANERAWGAAVELVRDGAVQGVSDDGDEIHLRVKGRRRATPHDVFLFPEDEDWDCDCELPGDACLHVCAGIIATRESRLSGEALPEPKKAYKVRVRYDFRREGSSALSVKRVLLYGDGRVEPLTKPLARSEILAERGDVQAESLLATASAGALSGETLRRLLVFLEGNAPATLDGEPIELSSDPTLFRVRVDDDDEGFLLRLVRPPNLDELFRGAAFKDGVLSPSSHGRLDAEQRRTLIAGVRFDPSRVGRLVGDVLPRLREQIPVDVNTDRLPEDSALEPRVELVLSEVAAGLEVSARIVYGDPIVARVEQGVLKALGDVVPARDMGKERALGHAFSSRMSMSIGMTRTFHPAEAAEFLTRRLPLFDGVVQGSVDVSRFQVAQEQPRFQMAVREDEGNGLYSVDLDFFTEAGRADPVEVLRAWAGRRPLVPLLDGGYAPLPKDWLKEHGAVLRELLEARQSDGTVPKQSLASLMDLAEGTQATVPPDLQRLREVLEGEEGMEEVTAPPGLRADLRHYQATGVGWLRFLRKVELNGVLADDMGLGKTLQALAAILDAGGRSLVVAPTSVLSNWKREANRFAPGLKVCVYHGPQRVLDPDADLVLTSYTLMRMDLADLVKTEWSYAVLDEAQAIKNPQSQTARAACKLRAKHRLCLSGTPVENRLEELWSLFHFLIPGFLGSLATFRERFARPIENGDLQSAASLRRRIRPYVLRRLKSQVATELPPLTEMVVECEMSAEQRKVYEAVRLAQRAKVQEVLADGKVRQGQALAVLEALLRMRQAACDPALLPGEAGQGAPSAKLDRLEELLVELVVDDHKALVFSQWTSMLDRVEVRLRELGIAWVRLDGSTRDRKAVIDAFQDPKGPPVFLLSLKAGGTGLNLTAADYVVHLDPWWNPAVEQQATDRAHRIGQDKPVVSLKLVAEGTVEERILALQEAKRDVAEAALGADGGMLRALSATELRDLFDS
ncbi:MAG: DEAD/DEAH box helicase [Deltaproteobacteria bacterium]|nr:MAG: DEAD/DEAH box helicase [Deltaproteobacteria bacterium]